MLLGKGGREERLTKSIGPVATEYKWPPTDTLSKPTNKLFHGTIPIPERSKKNYKNVTLKNPPKTLLSSPLRVNPLRISNKDAPFRAIRYWRFLASNVYHQISPKKIEKPPSQRTHNSFVKTILPITPFL